MAWGGPSWDGFWLYLSRTLSAITVPIYLFVIFLSYRIFGFKKTVLILVMAALLIVCTEQLSILFKNGFGRLRPCHQAKIVEKMRLVQSYCGGQFGYFSAHAANSWAFVSFFVVLFRSKIGVLTGALAIWAFLVSYSRIYIGVHFPLDVITGMAFGILFGCMFGYIFSKQNKHSQWEE